MKLLRRFRITIIIVAVIAAIVIFFVRNREPKLRKYKVRQTELSASKRAVEVNIFRYEKDLFGADMTHLAPELQRLSGIYPDILIAQEVWKDTLILRQLRNYLTDRTIRSIYDETMRVFPNLDDLTEELKTALGYFHYYFPSAPLPVFYTLVPGLDFQMPSVYAYGDAIFINLDMYLGGKNQFYNQFGMPQFIIERCDKKYLAIDCFKKALVYKFLPEQRCESLLDHMIFEGKKLYFTELMFPNRLERDIIGYSEEKWAWAEQFQPEVWNYLIENEYLFSKDDDIIRKFIEEAPFTKPFKNTSPGRLGVFLGWKIVQGYMENNPQITIAEFLQNTDNQAILSQSRYKPLKK